MISRTTGPTARLTAALRDAWRRTAGLGRRGAMERRLDDEMRFHVDMAAERNVRQGMAPAEARRAALAAFGGTERFKDDARDEYRSRTLDELGRDARYAARVLRRNPGFTVAAVLTFALGVGASTAIFSVVHGVLLRPLPYADPDRLVAVWEHNVPRNRDRNVVSAANFTAWRERSRSFEGLAALVPAPVTVAGTPRPERVVGAEVSPGYFGILGVAPALGREFAREEEVGGAADVVILSDGFWKSRFGGDRGVLGRTLTVNGRPRTIVGVMPAGFDPPKFGWLAEQAFWLPFAVTEQYNAWGRFLLVVGRLRRDVTLGAARAEMAAIAAARAREDRANEGWSASIVPLAEQITGEVRTPLLVLLGAVGLLLVMAIANVANLTLAFTRRRERELAVRRAIGASRARLLRQLLTQSVLLGALGAALGLAAAVGGVRVLVALLPPDVPRTASIAVDGTVLLFTTAVAVVATVAFGALAAVRGIPSGGSSTLVGSTAGRASGRLRGGALVTAEVALGLVLTVLAGLMVRTFVSLRAVDLGFDAESVVAARLALVDDRYDGDDAAQAFFEQLLERLRTTPGVQSASEVSTRPFGGDGPATSVSDPARPFPPGTPAPVADFRFADAALFRTLRVPVVAGTTFDAREVRDGPPRIVVNETLARTLWPAGGALGRRVKLDGPAGMVGTVIGVVGDVHLADARTPPRPTIYFASSRFPSDTRDIIVRGSGDIDGIVASLREAVAALDPNLPVYNIAALDALVDRSLARDRFTTLLLGAFAVIALLLAGVGIYGVFSGDVAQRRKEIGIRLALGAGTAGVLTLVMRRALVRAIAGIAIGVVAALAAARSMASMLFGVGATDLVSFGTVASLLLGVALLATLIPALRAARVSPVIAIRADT